METGPIPSHLKSQYCDSSCVNKTYLIHLFNCTSSLRLPAHCGGVCLPLSQALLVSVSHVQGRNVFKNRTGAFHCCPRVFTAWSSDCLLVWGLESFVEQNEELHRFLKTFLITPEVEIFYMLIGHLHAFICKLLVHIYCPVAHCGFHIFLLICRCNLLYTKDSN